MSTLWLAIGITCLASAGNNIGKVRAAGFTTAAFSYQAFIC